MIKFVSIIYYLRQATNKTNQTKKTSKNNKTISQQNPKQKFFFAQNTKPRKKHSPGPTAAVGCRDGVHLRWSSFAIAGVTGASGDLGRSEIRGPGLPPPT